MMKRNDEAGRHLVVFACAASGAAVVWLVFHSVYSSLEQAAQAVGYVDSGAKMGITFSYLMMVVGTAILAIVALRSAYKAAALWLRARKGG